MVDKKIEKEWTYKGLKCLVLFVNNSHRCGYVGVKKDNPAFGLDYLDLPISVHGGLTYGEFSLLKNDSKSVYWLGFDCAHFGDKTLYNKTLFSSCGKNSHFWTKKEVIAETEELADQLSQLTWDKIVVKKLEFLPDWFTSRVVLKTE